jgi:hypothetical protein
MLLSKLHLHLPDFLTWPDIWTASPIAALWTSLVFVLVATIAFVLIALIFGRLIRKLGSLIIAILQVLDNLLVKYCSWIVGTRWPDQRIRIPIVLIVFFSIAVGGTLVRWPYCLWILTFGLFGVLVVYRHWSHNEDAVEYQVQPADKDVQIKGSLNIELIIACAFVFVYAPIGFAQLHQHRGSFEIPSETNPFAFVCYMLIELTKVIPFHDFLPFPKGEQNPPLEVKSAIIAFQATLFVIIVAALKRFFDIARRVV